MKKKFTLPPILRAVSILFLLLMWSFKLEAQVATNPVLTWDQQVGCIEYDDQEIKDKEREVLLDLLEGVEDSKCIRFCEKSKVNFTLQASNVVSVEWQVTGGTLGNSSNTNATIAWGSSGSGSISITITYANNTTQVRTICVEKIIRPGAKFQIDGPDPSQKEFCTDSSISFDNLSSSNNGTAIVHYHWDFGDGTTSNLFEPTHTYTQSGSYKVVLTVTNSCNCSSQTVREIYIKDAKPIEITCANVTCEGSRETYTANSPCGGKWHVEGGTIVGENGNSIDVVWDNVDPSDGFGYVSFLSECTCPFWNTIKIPVVLRRGIIKGPAVICQGKQGRFSLPQWPTTDFKWTLQSSGTGTTIALTDQRNEVVIDALTPGDYELVAEYRNTLLADRRCSGRASIKFRVVENVSIIADNNRTVCQGTNKTFSSSNGNSVQWQITWNNGVVYNNSGSAITYAFNNPGMYVVTANNNGCISDPVMIEVIKTPKITGKIEGPSKVCLNVPYTYTITENEAGALYVWSVTGGSVIGNNQGTQVDVIFTNATGSVSVVKQYVKNGVTCSSAPVSFNVSQVVLNPVIVNNSGLTMFCTSKTYTFTANLGGIDVDHIEWQFNSSNFGSIVDGINSNTVTVGLNEVSGNNLTGVLQLTTVKCGVTKTATYRINLVANVTLSMAPIPKICPGNLSIDVSIGSNASASASSQLVFEYDGQTPYTTPYTGPGNYTIPQNFVTNAPNSIGGVLTAKLVNPFGCGNTVLANLSVIILPLTKVTVFRDSMSPASVCPPNPFSIKYQATVSTGITNSVEFRWYKGSFLIETHNGNPNFELHLGNYQGSGFYRLEVTDSNGCIVKSKEFYVAENCGPGTPGNPGGGGCPLPFEPRPGLTYSWTNCNTVTVTPTYYNVSPYDLDQVTWSYLTSGVTVDAASNNNSGVFTIPEVGSYDLLISVRYKNCPTIFQKIINVRKNYQPIMRYTVTCSANNTYSITLINNSMMFDIAPTAVTRTFINMANNSVVGTGDNATITGLTPGTYNFKMRLTTNQLAANGTPIPACEITQQIVLDPTPSLLFLIPDGTNYCTESAVKLRLPGSVYNSNYTYEWLFNGTSYKASGVETKVNFALSGTNLVQTFPIRLRITNQHNCVYESSTQSVTVRKANFSGGSVVPNPADFCESNALPLTYTGPVNPTNVIWMRGNVQVSTNMSYIPTQSGSYWPILIDVNGCKYFGMSSAPVSYKLRKVPFASINGNTSVCYGGSTTLTGIISDPMVQHRWSGPNLPSNYGNWVTGNNNLSLNLSGLAVGNHTYSFETRYANDTSCVNSFTSTVVAHPQIATPTISVSLVSCQPYTLKLTASGPNNGTYNWSNGAVGKSIEVTIGGAYAVTYTAPTGCSVTGSLQVPHNPERSLWVVPTGCYTLCLTDKAYLLGPLGIYGGYNWMINGGAVQSGWNTSVPNQYVNMAGTYQLQVSQLGCTFKSNTLHIAPDLEKCPPRPCKIEAYFKYHGMEKPGMYVYDVVINNPFSYNVVVNISSFNNYGTFSQSSFNLTPGWNSFYPVFFIANSTFVPGAPDYFMLQMQGCMDLHEVSHPKEYYGRPAATAAATSVVQAKLTLSPNPAQDITVASFDLGDQYQQAQNIVVYDVTGVQRAKQKVSGGKGEITLNVHHLAAGTYIVSLEADGQRVLQQKLIKK